MRTTLAVLILAATVFAEQPEENLAAAKAALAADPGNGALQRQWAKAAVMVARVHQRAEGYDAAIEFLESRLTHEFTIEAYAEACLWGGREERGIDRLRRATQVPLRLRIDHEFELLCYLRRFDEAAERARTADWPEGAKWAEAVAKTRAGLLERGRRAWLVSGIALLVIASLATALAVAIQRRAPR